MSNDDKNHEFWNTQPVPQASSDLHEKPIQEIAKVDPASIPREPLPIPLPHLVWSEVDPRDEQQISELTALLRDFYVEDPDLLFRFAYSADMLRWWLTAPTMHLTYSVGIRDTSSGGALVGYICGLPGDYSLTGRAANSAADAVEQTPEAALATKTMRMLSVNFLCLHKSLRKTRLAPLLIKELTRRAHTNQIYQAVYTEGTKLTLPIATATYYHRLLNPIKLARVKFAPLPKGMPEKKFSEFYHLPAVLSTHKACFRRLAKKDASAAFDLVDGYARRSYKFRQAYSKKLFAHMVRNVDNVMSAYVYEAGGAIRGLISWYIVDSQVLVPEARDKYPFVRNGYIYQYALADHETPALEDLFLLALHQMAADKVDVCTCLDIMDNEEPIKALRFDRGDGTLNYHLYNVTWNEMQRSEIGVVLM